MKKIICLLCVMLLLSGLVGCGTSDSSSHDDRNTIITFPDKNLEKVIREAIKNLWEIF